MFKPFLGMQLPSIFPVTEALVEEALKQIAINHKTTEDVIGHPYFASFMAWNHDLTPVNIPEYGPYMPSQSTDSSLFDDLYNNVMIM